MTTKSPANLRKRNAGQRGGNQVLCYKLILILWLVVTLCNLLVRKVSPELSGWYPAYSIVVAFLTTAFLLRLAS